MNQRALARGAFRHRHGYSALIPAFSQWGEGAVYDRKLPPSHDARRGIEGRGPDLHPGTGHLRLPLGLLAAHKGDPPAAGAGDVLQ